jgi:hypothetical protein
MKTNVEINGYVISIEEENGVISVNATKDDEVVEEFTLQTEEGEDFEGEEGAEGEDVKTFGDYEEEEDFEDGDEFEGEDDDDDDDDDFEEMPKKVNDMALESFQSFINKKRK